MGNFSWDYWDLTDDPGGRDALTWLFPDSWNYEAMAARLEVCGNNVDWVTAMLTLAVTHSPRYLSRANLAAADALPHVNLDLLCDYLAHPSTHGTQITETLRRHRWTNAQVRHVVAGLEARHPARLVHVLSRRQIPLSTRRRLLRLLTTRHRAHLKAHLDTVGALTGVDEPWLADALAQLAPAHHLGPLLTVCTDGDALARRLLSVHTFVPELAFAIDTLFDLDSGLRTRLAARVAAMPATTGRDLALLQLNDATALDLVAAVPTNTELIDALPYTVRHTAHQQLPQLPPGAVPLPRVLELLADPELADGRLPLRGRPARRRRRGGRDGRDTLLDTAIGAWAATADDTALAAGVHDYLHGDRSWYGAAGDVSDALRAQLIERTRATGNPALVLAAAHDASAAWVHTDVVAVAYTTSPLDALPDGAAYTLLVYTLTHLLAAGHPDVADMVLSLVNDHTGTMHDLVGAAAAAAGLPTPPPLGT